MGAAVDKLAAVEGLLLLGLPAPQHHLLLDVVEDGVGGVFGEGEREVTGVLVDEATDSGHEYVAQGRLHKVLQRVVAHRLQQPARTRRLLALRILKG